MSFQFVIDRIQSVHRIYCAPFLDVAWQTKFCWGAKFYLGGSLRLTNCGLCSMVAAFAVWGSPWGR